MQCLIHGNGLNFQKIYSTKDLWGEQSLIGTKGEIKLPDVIAAAKLWDMMKIQLCMKSYLQIKSKIL